MYMKIIHTLLFCSTFFIAHAAEDSVFTKAKLSHVSVYHTVGAELQHAAKVSLKPGLQYVVIDQLSHQLDESSFRLGCPDNVTILSWQHSLYVQPYVPPVANAKLDDSIRTIRLNIAAVNNDIQITEELLRKLTALVDNNFTTPDKKNILSAELIRLSDYYLQKIKDLKYTSWNYVLKRDVLNEQLVALQNRQNEPTVPKIKPPLPTGRLILQVLAQSSTNADFNVNYFTPHAGWIPTYDMRMKTIDQSFVLNYKAAVSQQTGIDWEGVPLTLTTQRPSTTGNMPMIQPIFLQLYVPQLYSMMEHSKTQGAPSIRSAQEDVSVEDSDKPANVAAYTTLSENMLNVLYNINLPYTIPSNGKAYTINIKDENVSASYRHMAIPKIDPDTYFTANIAGWNTLNLLPGESNIIIDNVYMGKSFIDPNVEADTLVLSLGKDKRIALTRLPVKDFTSVSKRNDMQTNVYMYEITVRNNKNKRVDITVKDQYPISSEKEIDVKLLKDGDAQVDAETGILTWSLTLEPGETKKLRFSYQVKIPAGKKVREMRRG